MVVSQVLCPAFDQKLCHLSSVLCCHVVSASCRSGFFLFFFGQDTVMNTVSLYPGKMVQACSHLYKGNLT